MVPRNAEAHDTTMNNDTIIDQPPTPPKNSRPARGPRRKLYRSSDDHVIAGVAGGIADYFDIDPLIVRIGFVVLTLTGGAGLLAYLGGWLLLPEANGDETWIGQRIHRHRRGRVSNARQLAAIALVGIGVVMLLDRVGIGFDGAIAWPIALIGSGAAVLWSQRDDVAASDRGGDDDESGPQPPRGPDGPDGPRAPDGPGGPGRSEGFTSSNERTDVPGSAVVAFRPHDSPTAFAPDVDAPSARVGPDSTRRVRRAGRAGRTPFARAALGLLLASIGVGVLAARVGAFDNRVDRALAVTLVVIGAVLVVGSWLGRPRGFLFVGVVLTAALLLTSTLNVSWRGGFGDRLLQPSIGDVKPTYRLTAGRLHLDLSQLAIRGRRVQINAETSVGQVLIEVPAAARVVAVGSVGLGDVRLFGSDQGGVSQNVRRTVEGDRADAGTLYVTARAGAGQVQIARPGQLQGDVTR